MERRVGRDYPDRYRPLWVDSPAPPFTPGDWLSTHPTTGEAVSFEAPLPQDMRLLWEEVTSSQLPELG